MGVYGAFPFFVLTFVFLNEFFCLFFLLFCLVFGVFFVSLGVFFVLFSFCFRFLQRMYFFEMFV